ncbi:MAG: major capsid protein, partial [Candidatus Bathyarchaeota archaeon]|nr:major capsid protein [Candidatus Bathyarchaeota archaeon]
VGHEWTDRVPEDIFMPEFVKTGYEPILNQEIMAQGTEADLRLYGYQTRAAYLKARKNLASGMFALPVTIDALFGSYVQAREFNSLPLLSMQFVSTSPENIRRDFLAYTNYPAFKLQIATDIKLVRCLPYNSVPETFGF